MTPDEISSQLARLDVRASRVEQDVQKLIADVRTAEAERSTESREFRALINRMTGAAKAAVAALSVIGALVGLIAAFVWDSLKGALLKP